MSRSWPSSPPIDDSSFESLISQVSHVVLHFWAEWNGYDIQLDRALAPLREEFADRVAFRAVDVDRAESARVCKDCNVTTVPTLAFFSHGKLVAKYVGLRSYAALRQQISELIGDSPPA